MQQNSEWTFLPIEEQALIMFAWSHPEIGHPDKLSFWRLALEMDVWWKFAQSTRTGLWARRTAYEVCEKWLEMNENFQFENLPLERQRWWLDTRARCLVVYDASILVSLAQYHEFLVHRDNDTLFESPDPIPLSVIEERTITKNLEMQGVAPLPAGIRQGFLDRYNYVLLAAPPDFVCHSLRVKLGPGEILSDPWIPILSLPRASITAESAYEQDFLPEISDQGAITLPSSSQPNSQAPEPFSSLSNMDRSSSFNGMHSSPAMRSQPRTPAEVSGLVSSDEFQVALAATKRFFQEMGASPAVSHLLYRLARVDSATEFAEFCRLYGSS